MLLGLWTRVGIPPEPPQPVAENEKPRPFRLFSIQGLLIFAFALYVGAEVLGSMWMVAYLVEVRHFTVADATPYATGFFVIMTLTRFGCVAVRGDRVEKWLILGGLVAGLTAFAIGLCGFSMAFPFVGLVGPYFPLVLARMSRYLPREAPSLTLRTLFIAQGMLAVCHFGMGYLATTVGLAVAYQVPVVVYAAVIVAMFGYLRLERGLKV